MVLNRGENYAENNNANNTICPKLHKKILKMGPKNIRKEPPKYHKTAPNREISDVKFFFFSVVTVRVILKTSAQNFMRKNLHDSQEIEEHTLKK